MQGKFFRDVRENIYLHLEQIESISSNEDRFFTAQNGSGFHRPTTDDIYMTNDEI